jgi:hypothetical protein
MTRATGVVVAIDMPIRRRRAKGSDDGVGHG